MASEQHASAGPWRMVAASNAITYAAIAGGLVALWGAFVRADIAIAGIAIAAAVVADTFDGAFARRFERSPLERAFGAQLDSLADAVVSGAVPPLVLLALTGGGSAGLWVAAFAWMVAVVTRLGYYDITASDNGGFTGLPAPVASLVVATALLWNPGDLAAAVLLTVLAAAMCSGVRIPRPRGRGLVTFALWPVVVMVLHAMRMGW